MIDIIFMGTADFACPILEKLIQNNKNYTIKAVYTQPPRPAGRGKKLRKTPIHHMAESLQLTIETPKDFNNHTAYTKLKSYNADIFIVVAYGLILQQRILDIPQYGCLNIHGSLLPSWRGAAPIHRAIIAGDQQTGVTLMKMDRQCDTGNIIAQKQYSLSNQARLDNVYHDLSLLGADITIEYLPQYIAECDNNHDITRLQDHTLASYAKKIDKSEYLLNFSTMDTNMIDRIVRGLYPHAYCFINDVRIKVLQGSIVEENHKNDPSHFLCQDNQYYKLHIIQPAGKKPMAFNDFACGYLSS